jgi:two-component system cell cycle response regulator
MRVLIAEDDPISRRRLEKRLAEWGYDVVSAADGERAWSILQDADPPPLAVLDWMMPKLDGPEICARLRKQDAAPYTYVILLTGKSAKEDVVAGLEAGADDYVTKPFDAQELDVRLRIGRRIIAMQTELHFRATRDPLTGTWNRGATIDALSREIVRTRRTSAPLTAILIDVDHFKHVNDDHGHLAGDEVLRELVRRMKLAVRPYDTIGRYGGEEFLAFIPDCNEGHGVRVADRMRQIIAATPFAAAGRPLATTASFGVAEYRAGEDVDTLIGRADAALYGAKREGRNRVVAASAHRADCK